MASPQALCTNGIDLMALLAFFLRIHDPVHFQMRP